MTALTAILGLLPAAFSTKIGAQSQRPLAIVVVGGMLTTLVFRNLAPMLYSLYGSRPPNAAASVTVAIFFVCRSARQRRAYIAAMITAVHAKA